LVRTELVARTHLKILHDFIEGLPYWTMNPERSGQQWLVPGRAGAELSRL
jgi:hypothetical protein